MTQPIEVPDQIKAECPPSMGFPEQRVQQVINRPDAQYPIQHGDLALQILVKHEQSWTDLVILQVEPARQLSFACRLLPEISESPLNDLSPLQLLQAFVDRFGLPVEIGSFEGLLLFNEEIPLSEDAPANLVNVRNAQDHSFSLFQFIRITEEKKSVDVAMAFAIDTTRYSEWHRS